MSDENNTTPGIIPPVDADPNDVGLATRTDDTLVGGEGDDPSSHVGGDTSAEDDDNDLTETVPASDPEAAEHSNPPEGEFPANAGD